MRRLQSDCAYEHLTYGFGEIVTAMKLQELFTSEDTFTRGALARDRDGNPARSPEAVAWDLDGAIQKCYGTPGGDTRARKAAKRACGSDLAPFSARCSFAELLRVARA
jgi:hypothetical protein